MRAARIAAGMTCDQAAALVGRTGSQLAKIERGEVRLFAHDALTLATAYGVTVESMLSPVDS